MARYTAPSLPFWGHQVSQQCLPRPGHLLGRCLSQAASLVRGGGCCKEMPPSGLQDGGGRRWLRLAVSGQRPAAPLCLHLLLNPQRGAGGCWAEPVGWGDRTRLAGKVNPAASPPPGQSRLSAALTVVTAWTTPPHLCCPQSRGPGAFPREKDRQTRPGGRQLCSAVLAELGLMLA